MRPTSRRASIATRICLTTNIAMLRHRPLQADRAVGGPSRATIERLEAVLERARIPASILLTRGRDIEAACDSSPRLLSRTRSAWPFAGAHVRDPRAG